MIAASTEKDKQEVIRFVTFDELTADLSKEEKQAYAKIISELVDEKVEGDAQMLEVTPEDILKKEMGIIGLRTDALVESSPSQQATEAPNHVSAFALPKTSEELKQNMIGYIGATTPTEHIVDGEVYQMTEVGSLKVAENYRGRGVGGKLFKLAVELALEKDLVPYAFCNEHSLPIAQGIALTNIEGRQAETAELPPIALEMCKGCPMYCLTSKSNPCCDTVWVWYPKKQQASQASLNN